MNKILIVDDIEKNIQLAASSLANKYHIEYATNGKDALDWIQSDSFDLVLLDIMMPGMDGFQVCETIRTNHDLDDMSIIFLTAKTDTNSILKGFQLGGQDYILKPFNPEELKARVKTHIDLKNSKEKLKDLNTWLEEEVSKKTQELKEAFEELEVLDHAKNEFLSMLSHELRTPLNGIMGFSNLLKQQINSDKLNLYIDVVLESSRRLEKFSNNALLISKLNTKKYQPSIDSFNLNVLFDEIKKTIGGLAETNSVEINIENNSDEPILVTDRKLLKEAIVQILRNAINFAPKNSVVNIEVDMHGASVVIIISDAGPGFNESALKNAFKPFGTGNTNLDGEIGLGLYIVKLIIDLLSADVSIANRESGGASIEINIPVG